MPVEQKVRFNLPLPASDSVGLPEDYEEMVAFLSKALKEKKQGKDDNFLMIIDFIQKKVLSDSQVKILIRSVSGKLSHMELAKDLIYALLAHDWLNKPSDFVSCYLHFLQNVVSVNAVFINPTITMLVDCFVSAPENYPDIPSETIFDYTHTAIIKILQLIPRGPGILLPILSQKLPHKSDSTTVQKLYVKSLLYIAEYAPVIRDELIQLVLELIIQIDIEIQVEDLEDEDDQDIFAMEIGKNEPESDDSDSEAGSLLYISSDSKVMAAKLDALLCIMFDYIKILSKKAQADENSAKDFSLMFDGILHSFDNIMLPTHKLRSAQFIIFYFCSLETSFAQDFMGLLVTHLVEPSNSSVVRMASSSYLGSFIARAKFVDIPSVRQCLSILNHQCQTYVDQYESGIKGRLEVDRYGVLYGSVQAILYIFCFRWKQLMRIEDKPLVGAFPAELNGFQRVLLSKFHPLKVCSEAIVAEFAKITNNLNMMYCYSLMQSGGNKSDSAPSVSVCERLDTFFPFDPLYPPLAKTYVQDFFQEWEGADDNDNDVPDSDISASLQGMSLDDRFGMSMSMSVSIN